MITSPSQHSLSVVIELHNLVIHSRNSVWNHCKDRLISVFVKQISIYWGVECFLLLRKSFHHNKLSRNLYCFIFYPKIWWCAELIWYHEFQSCSFHFILLPRKPSASFTGQESNKKKNEHMKNRNLVCTLLRWLQLYHENMIEKIHDLEFTPRYFRIYLILTEARNRFPILLLSWH